MSDFSALNTATTGLHAHQKRINVIGENIANMETPGYHRQTTMLTAIDTQRPGLFSGNERQHGGVTAEVNRRWDELLDTNAKRERGRSASLETQATELGAVEAELGSLGEGLATRFQELWNSFDDIANTPDDLAVRNVVLGNAEAVASGLRHQGATLDGRREATIVQVNESIRQANQLSIRIAELDQTIVAGQAIGTGPHGAMDERDRLASELISLTGGEISYNELGQVRIAVDGFNLVGEGQPGVISVDETADPSLAPLGYDRVIVQSPTGRELSLTAGSVHGYLQVANVMLPEQVAGLNNVAATTVSTVNGLHQTGFGLDGTTGSSLFDPTGVRAVDVAVSIDVAGRPERIAASDGSATLDNSVALAIAELGTDPNGPSNVHARFVADLGSRVDTLNGRADVARLASEHAEGARQSAVGVNLDEELADLVSAQRAYEASARMISAVDQMLDTLINRTGIVGR
ncbi:MAG: flagellar hook-associated protein FlgK [Acidimicrobiales bacterium]